MFFKGKFFPFKKISNSFIKIVFPSACSHLFFFFLFYFPLYLGHQQLRIQKAFFPQRFANHLDEQVSGLSWNLNPRKVSRLQSDAHGSGSEDCFSIAAGMGNPLVQRKKRWKVENPAAGQPLCPAPKAGAGAMLQFSPALAAELDCCGPP